MSRARVPIHQSGQPGSAPLWQTGDSTRSNQRPGARAGRVVLLLQSHGMLTADREQALAEAFELVRRAVELDERTASRMPSLPSSTSFDGNSMNGGRK